MALSLDEAADLALAALSPEERRGAILYLDEATREPGSGLEIDGVRVEIAVPTLVAFVDREPGVNWAHDCRYLLIDAATGAVRSLEARLPPFLRRVPATLGVVWRGEEAPAWADVTG